jgi:putative ABC transport system permease protein
MLTVTLRLMGEQSLLNLKPVAIDLRVMTFAAVVAVASLTLITLWSTWAAARSHLMRGLADGGGTTRRERAPISILALQVSLALVISVAGALVAGSLLRVWGEDPGFDADRTVIVKMASPKGASGGALEELVTSINQIPGVAHAGATAHPVMEALTAGNPFSRPPGVPNRPNAESVNITHGYLEAAGLQLVEGRLPTREEFVSGSLVMVVSRLVAARYWPGQRAVGKTLVNNRRNDGRTFTVIGVVPDARYLALDRDTSGEIYWPLAARPLPYIENLLVRFDSQQRVALPTLVTAIKDRCPDCWIFSAQTFTDAMASTIRPRQFSAWLFSAFGVSALVIVGAGILGLVAMTTSRRTKEIAIRMTLGATRGGVMFQLLREQAVAVTIGLALGGVAAVWIVRFVATYLYKTQVYDVRSWAAAIGVLLLVTAIGALIPSHRASRLDPVRAMRIE